MIKFEEFGLKTPDREAILDITKEISNIVKSSNIKEGVCRVFIQQTTAGITIN